MSAVEVYDSAARQSPWIEEAVALLRYRSLVIQWVLRTVKTRYKRSMLGVAWSLAQPFMTMAAVALVFSSVFGYSARSYALFVLSGLLVWNFFAQSVLAAMNDLRWSGGLLDRVYMPKATFAVAAVGTGLVNFVLTLVAYLALAVVLDGSLKLTLLLFPIPLLSPAMFTLGIALLLSALLPRFPDVLPTFEVFLTIWMYLSAVIYPAEVLPSRVQAVLRLNPMYYPLAAFRDLVYAGQLPVWSELAVGYLLAALAVGVGWWSFANQARDLGSRV